MLGVQGHVLANAQLVKDALQILLAVFLVLVTLDSFDP